MPAGLYDCWIGSMNLGQIALKGDKFRGPAFDGRYEGPAGRYAMSGPTIDWEGPVGGISLAGAIVSTVAKGWDDGTLSGFDVTLQNAESGNFQTVSCLAPG
jgi:hypothetical protein